MGASLARLRNALDDPDSEVKLRKAFDAYDANGNGFLEQTELLAFARDLRSVHKSQSEGVEHSEHSFVVQILAQLGTNVNFDDFVSFVRAHPHAGVSLITIAKNEILCEWESRGVFVCGSLASIFDYQWKEKIRQAAADAFGDEEIPDVEELDFFLNGTKQMSTLHHFNLYLNGCLWTGDDDFVISVRDARNRPAGHILVKYIEKDKLRVVKTPLLEHGDSVGALRQRIIAQLQLAGRGVKILYHGKFLTDETELLDSVGMLSGHEISLVIEE